MKKSLLALWQKSSWGKKFWLIVGAVLIGWGIFLRFYHLPTLMQFRGDQGMDLIAAWRIVKGEFFPHIGPLTNIPNFFTAPTYYYFLAGLLAVFHSETVLVFIFALLNIFSGILFALFTKERFDSKTAFVFFVLYMISICSIEQARILWQPHPIAFFISLCLWLFIYAEKTKKVTKWIGGVISAAIGMTVYVGGMVLFPFLIFQGARFWKLKKLSSPLSYVASSVFLFLFFFSANIPNLLYELRHNLPTYHSFFSEPSVLTTTTHFATPDSFGELLARMTTHFSTLMYSLIPHPFFFDSGHLEYKFFILTALLILSLLVVSHKKSLHIQPREENALGIGFIVISFFPILFLETGSIYHRFFAYLPLLLIGLSFLIVKLVEGRGWKALLGAILFLIFFVTNGAHFPRLLTLNLPTRQTYGVVQSIRLFLLGDMAKRGISFENTDLHQITHDDYYDYEMQALWYLLYKNDNLSVPVTEAGNDTIRSGDVPKDISRSYLICFMYHGSPKECEDIFLYRNPNFVEKSRTTIGTHTVIFLEKIQHE